MLRFVAVLCTPFLFCVSYLYCSAQLYQDCYTFLTVCSVKKIFKVENYSASYVAQKSYFHHVFYSIVFSYCLCMRLYLYTIHVHKQSNLQMGYTVYSWNTALNCQLYDIKEKYVLVHISKINETVFLNF